MATGRESDKFMLRLPEGMRDRIKAAADANNRSMNAEIVGALAEKYPEPEVSPDVVLHQMDMVATADPRFRAEMVASLNQMLETNGASFRVRPDGEDRLCLETPDPEAHRDYRAAELAKTLANIELDAQIKRAERDAE